MPAPTIIDQVEAAAVMNFPLGEMPLTHFFTPGLYGRRIEMKAGMLVVSETHKYEHQFVVLEGIISVWTPQTGEVILEAGYNGITPAGTRRMLYIHEDAVWMTFHSTLLVTVEEIHEDIIEKVENPLLGGRFRNNVYYPSEQNKIE